MSADMSTQPFGDLLRRYRRVVGLSQEGLAERAGLSTRGISDLERGVNRTPQRETVTRLADALKLNGEDRARFEESGQRRGSDSSPTFSAASSLPTPLTALRGRDEAVRDITKLIRHDKARLVTLTGPGGVGKTRLALAVAAGLAESFPDGVTFVPLASLTDADLVPTVLAQSTGLRAGGGNPLADDLAAHLRAKRLLLVVDNFEHLLPAAPELARLLESCPQLAMLVTSRATLRLRGERDVRVEPLALPDPRRVLTPDALGEFAAVAVFVERVQEHHPEFVLDSSNAATIAKICIQLDGLPLALELAAAQIRLFSPRTLLVRLERRLAVLTGGPRDLSARQSTMRATVAWSYDLLPAEEQQLFRRLAVFIGGCTPAAIEAIYSPESALPDTLFDLLGALVSKSLLRRIDVWDAAEPRFGMLEIIREYGLEVLAASDELETVRQMHAVYCLALAQEAAAYLNGSSQAIWLARLESDHDNLRSALGWSLHDGRDPALGLRLTCALGRFWVMCAYYREGAAWLAQALTLNASGDADLRATALGHLGNLVFWIGELDRSLVAYEEALALRRAEGNPARIATALLNIGNIDFERGDYVRAQGLFEESLALAEQGGDRAAWARTLNNVGVIAQIQGNYDRALAAYERCAQFWREQGDTWNLSTQLNNIGEVATHTGHLERARGCFLESLRLRREQGDRDGVAWTLRSLGYLGYQVGRSDYAARVLAVAASISAQLGATLAQHSLVFHEQQLEGIRERLGDAAYATAWMEAQTLPYEEALDFALSLQTV